MAKKITVVDDELLEDIEAYGEDQYTLEEAIKELKLPLKLAKDESVIEAFVRGQVLTFISLRASDEDYEAVSHSIPVSLAQYEEWDVKYRSEIIELKKARRKDAELKAGQVSRPIMLGMRGILYHNGSENAHTIDQDIMAENIVEVAEKAKRGDMDHLLHALTSQVMQLQALNNRVIGVLDTDVGRQYDNYKDLSNLSIKVSGETRKSIMAINEICNPRRTTFVKNAIQNNHLKAEEPEIKNNSETVNELSQPKEFIYADQYTKAKTITKRTDK